MYNIAKNAYLKREIFSALDKEKDYISTQELAKKLSRPAISVSTLYKFCNELKTDIESTYSPENMELIINPRYGIKLNRENVTFQPLFEKLFMAEPAYAILKEVFQKKQLNTANFCISFHISESQLRRRVKQLNDLLNIYHLHITVSKNITLRGDNYYFRYFYFEFLLFSHYRLSNIEWVTNTAYYLNLSHHIAQHLNYPAYGDKLEVLALWLYVNDLSHVDFSIPSHLEKALLNSAIKKPGYLSYWTNESWRYFTSFLYASNLFDIQLNMINDSTLLSEITQAIDSWTDLFEIHFRSKEPISRQDAANVLTKYFIRNKLFPSSPLMNTISDISFFTDMQNNHPRYYKIFAQFYAESLLNESMNELNLSIRNSLLICLELFNVTRELPIIQVYFNSSYSYLNNLFNIKKIEAYFNNRVNFIWKSDLENIDLLLSTSDNIHLAIEYCR